MTQPLRALHGWWQDRPLRTRLVAAAAIAVAIVACMVIAIAYVAVRHELIGQIDSQLRAQAGEVRVVGNEVIPPRRFGETSGYFQVLNAGEPPDAAQQVTLPVEAPDRRVLSAHGPQSVFHNTTVQSEPVRILTTRIAAGAAIQVALPLGAIQDQLHHLSWEFAGLGLGGLLLTVGLAWLLSRTVMAPVARLTAAAERVAVTRDLTHRIVETRHDELGRLAVSFNTMLDALQQSIVAQRQLVADASHELRTPLASMRTNIEILAEHERLTPAQHQQVLDAIVGQLEELTSLVADVVELARGDEPAAHLDEVALDRLVSRAVDKARGHWPAVQFTCTTVPVTVLAVGARVERAVTNLLDNAAKFAGAGTTVEVDLTSTGVLTVRDHGPGVPEDALPHVFDRFYRADEARGLPGSGLGLAIVAQVARAHGSTVSLTNAPDGGAVATLTLPVAADAWTGSVAAEKLGGQRDGGVGGGGDDFAGEVVDSAAPGASGTAEPLERRAGTLP